MPLMLLRLLAIMLLGAVVVVATPRTVTAQQTGALSLEIAVVDVQKILRQSLASRTIRPQLAKIRKKYRERFKKQEQELRAANQDLARQRTILSPEAYEAQRKAFRLRASNAQREVQAAQRRLDSVVATAMRKVHRTLQGVTAKYASEKNIKLILPKSGVLLMETRFDITAEILKRLNKKLPALTLQLSPPTAAGLKGKDGKK